MEKTAAIITPRSFVRTIVVVLCASYYLLSSAPIQFELHSGVTSRTTIGNMNSYKKKKLLNYKIPGKEINHVGISEITLVTSLVDRSSTT